MPQSITLTASMRSNLASLKSIQSQMDTTQTRLSTGKKVNSAIDNASSYYQSRALTNRASDLDSLLDSMGQGIQTIQAANEGIESVTAFIEQAKSIANSAFALDSTAEDYVTQVNNYQTQFNQIIKEIGTLSKDSSYQGINLLTGGKLTVMFNETRTHWLDVQGKDIVSDMAASNIGFDVANWVEPNSISALADDVTAKENLMKDAEYMINAAITDQDTLDAAIAAGTVYTKSGSASPYTFTKVTGSATYAANTFYKHDTSNTNTAYTQAKENYDDAVEAYNTAVKNVSASINASLDAIGKAIDYLRDYSSELGNNFAIIETRQNFTEAVIDVLETGSDNLVLADMNEESANYLALQTRQQLAINSLALASQSAQSVLKLFG